MDKKVVYKIGGMTCASCASVIEYSLKKEKGINSIAVNLASEKAYIDFNQESTNENNIKKSVTIDNVDAQMFTYHGIGFICPGAIAQFKLTEPKGLIFSDQAILKYKD